MAGQQAFEIGAMAAENSLSAFRPLRVIELGSWLAAPSACSMLADLGAEVIKVEPLGGDPLRNFPSSMRGGNEKSPGFTLLNRGKKSVVLDVMTPQGQKDLDALMASADVLLTNMRTLALERAGLDAESVSKRFPRLIYASLTGQGLAGPDRNRAGFDTGSFWARSGMLHQMTSEGAEPLAFVGGYGDLMTSLAMFSAVMVGLFERQKTGLGRVVEASLLQTGAWLLSGDVAAQAVFGRAPKLRSRSKSATPLVNSYKTSDSRWFFLTAVESGRHFAGVCRAIGRPELVEDSRFAKALDMRKNAPELIALLDEAFARESLEYWAACFKREGVLWEKVATPSEMMDDPQIGANRMAAGLAWGDSAFRAVTAPFRIHGFAMREPSYAPELGANNEEIFAGKAAYAANRKINE